MARIRTIKPEFWTSEQVMECSTNARLLFIGLWNFCDDAGRMAASSKRIKASVFPSDDFTADDVRRMIVELSSNGLIGLYVVDGIEYLQVTGWHHQKIDRPQTSKLPEPPDPNSPNGRRTFGVGREGKGRESKGKDITPTPTVQPEHPRGPLNEAQGAGAGNQADGKDEPPPETAKQRFARVEAACRAAVPPDWLNDPVVGPMAHLEADGLDLDREIIPAILDIVAGSRTPIRTWRLMADKVAERVAVQRESRSALRLSPKPATPPENEERVSLGEFGCYPESTVRQMLARFRDAGSWIESCFGPPPGQPGCRVPPRLLIGEAA